jgi:hypothetical protein
MTKEATSGTMMRSVKPLSSTGNGQALRRATLPRCAGVAAKTMEENRIDAVFSSRLSNLDKLFHLRPRRGPGDQSLP